MKKVSKVLSIVLALAMLCSLFAFGVSAAVPSNIKFSVVQTSSSPDIYKVTLSLQCDYTLHNVNTIFLYDKTAFKLIRNTGVADTTATNANGYVKEGVMADDNIYDGSISHPVFGTSVDQFSPDYGYALGVGSGSFTFQVRPAAAAYGSLSQDKWQALLFDWTVNLDDNGLLFDCKEDTPVISFYLQKLDTAEPGNYEIGIIDGCKVSTVVYDPENSIDVYSSTTPSPPKAEVHVQNAFIEVKEETAPTVEKSKAELKFTLTSATEVADDYLFRVTSKISDADWDAYFANTGTSGATTDAIQKLGFVAYKGTDGFSMDTAKAVAQGTPAEGYYNATTDYVQKVDDTSDAYFGAIIDTSKDTDSDATYVAYVQYLDAEGQTAYAFYADAQTALLEQNYDTYVQQYVSEFGSGFAA